MTPERVERAVEQSKARWTSKERGPEDSGQRGRG